MDIKSIQLKHTNPSLGPYEEVSTVLLTVAESNMETIGRFLESSQVNGSLSMHDYIKARLGKKQAILEKVAAQAPKGKLTSGGSISHLSFHFKDGVIIELSDVYRKYKLTLFNPEFTSFMVEQGTIIRTSQNEDPLHSKELPLDFSKEKSQRSSERTKKSKDK